MSRSPHAVVSTTFRLRFEDYCCLPGPQLSSRTNKKCISLVAFYVCTIDHWEETSRQCSPRLRPEKEISLKSEAGLECVTPQMQDKGVR